ncbi:MAG: LytTR family transcriptional regulator DNA-binding domain-containing protein [Saprospiraceae bacterium]|nr:LytTR family transcriptional regulator DNA-binding domain-containing protein [Candidatus Brachybacter algidus]
MTVIFICQTAIRSYHLKLAYFEDILLDKNFYRSHRSYLVNGSHIKELADGNFILKNGMEIPISRRKETEAKTWFFSLE